VDAAKTAGCVEAIWGRQAHITEAAGNNTSLGELKRFIKFAQRHVNFHCSMTCDDLKGIVNLDAEVEVLSVSTGEVKGHLSLRQVLLRKFKLADGSSLIAEIHQRGPMGTVDVIVPNIPEAEAMVLMMNRYFPAFCLHYLTGRGMDPVFVRSLITVRSRTARGTQRNYLLSRRRKRRKRLVYRSWKMRPGTKMNSKTAWWRG
jgi:hypothetical protein